MSFTSKFQRLVSVTLTSAALAVGFGLSAVPAGAVSQAQNTKFCTAFTSNPKSGTLFGVPGRAQAKHTAALLRKLADTGVPTSLGKDLTKLARIYVPIADGQASSTVVAANQTFISKFFAEFTKYVQVNCTGAVPSS